MFLIDEYQFLTFQLPVGKGGGICMYIRNSFVVNIVPVRMKYEKLKHFQVAIAMTPIERMICAIIYRPSHTSISNFLLELNDYYSEILSVLNPDDEICFMGDFNINLMAINNNLKSFLKIMYSNCLFPLILLPSRITLKSCTLIDKIFINYPLTVDSDLIIYYSSDHLPVFVIMLTSVNAFNNKDDQINSYKRYLLQHRLNMLCDELKDIDWTFITDDITVDDDFYKFITCFLNKYYSVSIPSKSSSINILLIKSVINIVAKPLCSIFNKAF